MPRGATINPAGTMDWNLKPTVVVGSDEYKRRNAERLGKGGRKYGTNKRRNKKSKRNTRKK